MISFKKHNDDSIMSLDIMLTLQFYIRACASLTELYSTIKSRLDFINYLQSTKLLILIQLFGNDY